nr:WYL domain-containing protein [Lachnospiraceae bacterium]
NKMFDMFDGEDETVTIECDNYLAGVMIDRFGKEVKMHRTDANHFKVKVDVAVSKQFIHWVMSLGDGAKITAPESVVSEVKAEIKRLTKLYK